MFDNIIHDAMLVSGTGPNKRQICTQKYA